MRTRRRGRMAAAARACSRAWLGQPRAPAGAAWSGKLGGEVSGNECSPEEAIAVGGKQGTTSAAMAPRRKRLQFATSVRRLQSTTMAGLPGCYASV
ncbi:hypothetical protein PR202_ga21289 [Eleusine coracana subsp. coracana]|uniref:Uncharacterized protein n=1 Tax=Eleusine coracana subsp. coracana TaxID=191504 RepID=A0AAV5CYR8_ELECO|nr:hypothetical protein PR202_ga21289 [Eleusine coracana subsp. coracana]